MIDPSVSENNYVSNDLFGVFFDVVIHIRNATHTNTDFLNAEKDNFVGVEVGFSAADNAEGKSESLFFLFVHDGPPLARKHRLYKVYAFLSRDSLASFLVQSEQGDMSLMVLVLAVLGIFGAENECLIALDGDT
jgi:hypothetical protein